jgi:hypothetical protein
MGPLAPGETRSALAELLIPAGYPESASAIQLRAIALQAGGEGAVGPLCSQELVLKVAGGDALALSLADEVVGGLAARFELQVSSRSNAVQLVELAGSSPAGARVTITGAKLCLGPHEAVAVKGRVRSTRALAGEARRVPFVVSAKSPQGTCSAVATFVQAPWLEGWVVRALALVATVMAFVVLAVFIIIRLTYSYTPRANPPTSYRQVPALYTPELCCRGGGPRDK